MRSDDFLKQPRGPYSFDSWHWKNLVHTKLLGDLIVELSTHDDDPTPPDEAMIALAEELATFTRTNEEKLLDLIYGHYRYAEKQNWLEYWNVPAGLPREDVLSQVDSIALCVQRDRDEERPYDAAVYVNPNWDQEHKLDLRYRNGRIVEVNDGPFVLKNGVLYPH